MLIYTLLTMQNEEMDFPFLHALTFRQSRIFNEIHHVNLEFVYKFSFGNVMLLNIFVEFENTATITIIYLNSYTNTRKLALLQTIQIYDGVNNSNNNNIDDLLPLFERNFKINFIKFIYES